MSERPMFRAEAVRDRGRLQAPGDIARIGPTWTTWAVWALLALVVTASVAASTIEIARYAPGTVATDDRGRVVVLVPALLAPEIDPGDLAELPGGRAEVVATSPTALSQAEVRRLYRVEVAVPSVAVTTSASGQGTGTARILVETEPVIVALVPGLSALFGDGDA